MSYWLQKCAVATQVVIVLVGCLSVSCLPCVAKATEPSGSDSRGSGFRGIEPWTENAWYWSYRGQPVVLLGGSDDDSLFQWPEETLIPQLDRIRSAGGNVVRNTMSDRKDGGFEVYAFAQLESGQYDLTQWNPVYWDRFEQFLRETASRQIFVQIELWDRFDYTDNRAHDPMRWENHPYNPRNNVNYTRDETGLEERYPEHPGKNLQPFFFSTPKQRNITPLLRVQTAFVNKVMDHVLAHAHVMMCIDNETSAEPQWAEHWATLIRQRATEAGVNLPITEMWDDWELTAKRHLQTFDRPDLYNFVDVSQNNHNSGQKHWDNFAYVRNYLSDRPRPMNTTKIYGADGNKFGHSDQDAVERFWRHLLGGAASVRFHRPDSGLGISDKAVACLRAARHVASSAPIWSLSPAMQLLGDREDNEAYAASTTDHSLIVIYFPKREAVSSVGLQIGAETPRWQVLWIDVDSGARASQSEVNGVRIAPPSPGNWCAVLRRLDVPMLAGEFFEVGGRRVFVFEPKTKYSDAPQPWVLYSPTLIPNYPDEHERWLHEQLTSAGIAVAGIDCGEAQGSPAAVQAMTELYEHLIDERGFSPRPMVLGRSRGGLYAANWAAANPHRTAALAGIYPVFDLRSYPKLPQAAKAYDLSESELSSRLSELNPIAKAEVLAKQKIPVYIIHGADDTLVPLNANSAAVKQVYERESAGALLTLDVAEGQGHSYWPGFFRHQPLVDFAIQHAIAK